MVISAGVLKISAADFDNFSGRFEIFNGGSEIPAWGLVTASVHAARVHARFFAITPANCDACARTVAPQKRNMWHCYFKSLWTDVWWVVGEQRPLANPKWTGLGRA